MSTLVDQARAFLDAAYGGTGKGLAHSLEVGALAAEAGGSDEVVAAALLHDVVEDTGVGLDALREAFGDRIADTVAALTEDDAIATYASRKRALRERIALAGPAALAITAADKLARARAADRAGRLLPARKLDHYERTLAMLVAQGHHSAHTDELGRRLRVQRLRRQAAATAQAVTRIG